MSELTPRLQNQGDGGMVSVDAFNTLLREFADELELSFGDQPGVGTWNVGMTAVDKNEPLRLFTLHVVPFSQRIMAKDVTLLNELPKAMGGVDIHKLHQESDPETQEAIWSFLISLTMMAVAISNLPPEVMNTIERTMGQLMGAQGAGGLPDMLGGGGMGTIMQLLGGGGLTTIFGALSNLTDARKP